MSEASVLYNYVRGRQLEGTFSDDPNIGYWPVTGLRVGKGWGIPNERDWPYITAAEWPPAEPAGIDTIARRCRSVAYQRITTIDECRLALANRHPVLIALQVNSAQWSDAP